MKRFSSPARVAILTVAFTASATISSGQQQPTSADVVNFKKALAAAKQRNMPLLIVGHTDS